MFKKGGSVIKLSVGCVLVLCLCLGWALFEWRKDVSAHSGSRRLSRSSVWKNSDIGGRQLNAYNMKNSNLSDPDPSLMNVTKMEKQARTLLNIDSACLGTKPITALSEWERQWLLKHLIVDDQYQLLYCYVPKVGCANWKRVFNTLYGDVSAPDDVQKVDHHSMVLLSSYSEPEIQYRLKHYFKFMFVRDPVDRLLSAYRNKFGEHFAEFEQRYGIKIVQNFRPNPPAHPKGDDVTFAEFMLYVAKTKKVYLNEHWSAYVDLCQPCHVSYDFIGFYEDFDEDINFLLEVLKLDRILQFPKKQAYYKPVSDEEKKDYLKTVPDSTMALLAQQLLQDYELFGYSIDSPFGKSVL